MTRFLFFGLIKLLMVSAPFLSMMIMILALWGVVGKATYTDIEATTRQDMTVDVKEAKNYLVNETKIIEKCPDAIKSTDIGPEGENPRPQEIDWEHIV